MEVFGLSQVFTRITLLKKSMLLITLKHQNWVNPLSGNENKATNPFIVLR